jgi:hypothetical protein
VILLHLSYAIEYSISFARRCSAKSRKVLDWFVVLFDSFRHHRCLLVESNIFQHFLNCAATNRIPSYFVISQECKCLFSTKEPFRVLTFGFGSVIPGVTMQYSNHKQQYHIRCMGQSLSTLTSNGLFTISKGPIRSVFMNSSSFYGHFLQWLPIVSWLMGSKASVGIRSKAKQSISFVRFAVPSFLMYTVHHWLVPIPSTHSRPSHA